MPPFCLGEVVAVHLQMSADTENLPLWSIYFQKLDSVADDGIRLVGCHAFGIAFRVTTFLPWRGGCHTFADVCTFADVMPDVCKQPTAPNGR